MTRRRPLSLPARGTALLALAALTAVTLSSCALGRSETTASGKTKVVASFYPLEFVTKQIGREHIQVTGLTKPGVEPHDLELTPKQVGQVSDAKLAIYLKGMQPAVNKALTQEGPDTLVNASTYSPLKRHGTEVDGEHEHASPHEDHAHEDHAHEDHAHSGTKDKDPHIWLQPTRLAKVAQGIGTQLAKTDPEHRADYQRNTRKLVKRLHRLDDTFRDGLRHCTRRTFVTSHAAFGYLAERYHITQVAINGVAPDARPSPAKLKEIQHTIKSSGADTVFFETLASPKLAHTLAHDLHLHTKVLDPIEGVRHPRKDNYFTIMKNTNLTNLRSALGCS